MKKKEKAIILFTIFVFALLLPNGSVFADGNQKKLEIVYPVIPGTHTPKVISEGLPEYIEYIFTFSFYLIALIILAVLIYSGIQYFTSFGNPSKLTSAKEGIRASILGVLILLSSYLVFNTINPQLTTLVAPNPDIIEPSIKPGIYLCNYHPSGVNSLINIYKNGNKEEKIEAAIKLKEIMKKEKSSNACFRTNASTDLGFGSFNPSSKTGFVIPKKKITSDASGNLITNWEYNFGMIFHEKDNRRGESEVGVLYNKTIKDFSFSAHSVTLFEKNDASGCTVTLYQCLNQNEGDEKGKLCPQGLTGQPEEKSFPVVGNDPVYVSQAKLGKLAKTGDNEDGARSIAFFPQGSGFALLYSGSNFRGDVCNAFSENQGNLLLHDIGKCHAGVSFFKRCFLISDREERLEDCVPCLKSMIVIKGTLVK
ncbi:MAG: pilin [Patescibacteria group bacterium]|nr:pilin [Patescibacteria group bacterium]